MEQRELKPGDVVQLKPDIEPVCFGGCFMLVTEPKGWGAQGFIAMPKTKQEQAGHAYFRCNWEDMEYVGKAPWTIPGDEE